MLSGIHGAVRHRLCGAGVLLLATVYPTYSAPRVCDEVVSSVVIQFVADAPLVRLPRVEIRRCPAGTGEHLQIAAWASNALEPGVLVETYHFTLLQFAMFGNIVLIETGGGTTDRVFVISFLSGRPTLVLRRSTKDRARLETLNDRINVLIEDSRSRQVEAFTFPFSTEEFPEPAR